MRISVIVPCFNAARYLAEALASVNAQQSRPDEIIVVDDGSNDGSAAIATRFGGVVRCVRQEHRGISEARNRGVAVARGDVIAFLDADDVWTVDSIAVRQAVLQSDPSIDCAAGLVEQFISPELPVEIRRGLICAPGVSRGRLAGVMLVRRHVFDRVGMFDSGLRVGETLDWVARADACGIATQMVEAVVLRRRIHEANTTASNASLKSDYLRVLKASIDRRRAGTPPPPVK